jgi:phosphoglycolate phosphatase-like HAD superfamily hydrolase
LYSGVEQLIINIRDKGIKIALLTTKAQDQAELLLKHFSLYEKFDYVMGRRPGLAHKPSPEPLLKICSDLKLNVGSTMIVGDSELDVECGKNAGSKSCAVTYGYRTREDLLKSQPDFIVDSILEVGYIVNGNDLAL